MRPLLPIALLALLAAHASAGFKDGVFTSVEHRARFKLPKDWKVEDGKGENGKVVMFQSADGELKGVFRHVKEGMGASKHAKWRSVEWEKKGAAVTWDSEEKPKGREGDWLQVMLSMEAGPDEYKTAHLYFSKDKDDYELAVMVKAAKWADSEKTIGEILASIEYGEFKEDDADPAAGGADVGVGPLWADATRGFALRGAPGWTVRTQDFKIHDPNEIVEWETGDEEVMVSLSELANDGGLDSKAWADVTVEALGKAFKDQKMVEVSSPDGALRRDFTADNGGSPIHFSLLFFTRNTKAYYLQVMCLGGAWDKSKDLVEGMLASLVQGDVTALVSEMKSQKPTAAGTGEGGKEVLLPNPWAGCGKGSWAKYRLLSEVPGGGKSEIEMTTTLIDFDDESYTIRNDMAMGGKPIPGKEQRVSRRQKVVDGAAAKTEEGDEKITVLKGEFSCHWTKTMTDQGYAQNWTCPDVPGLTVRSVSEYSGTKATVDLVDFEKK
jgi:hypothetical protein